MHPSLCSFDLHTGRVHECIVGHPLGIALQQWIWGREVFGSLCKAVKNLFFSLVPFSPLHMLVSALAAAEEPGTNGNREASKEQPESFQEH